MKSLGSTGLWGGRIGLEGDDPGPETGGGAPGAPWGPPTPAAA